MAYDIFLEDRISSLLKTKQVNFRTVKMMGGLCYMVNEKMCCALVDKILMARIGLEAYSKALQKEGCSDTSTKGRKMNGFVFVSEDALDLESELEYWIDLCLAYNPLAKSSKK